MRTATGSLLIAAAVAAAATGCSSGDANAASTTTGSSTTTSTASTTTTTEPTTTTEDPIATAEQAAYDTVVGSAEAWRECVTHTPTCDPTEAFSPYYAGQILGLAVKVIEDNQSKGWDSRPSENPADGMVELISAEVSGDPPNEVLVTYCERNGIVVFEEAAGPNGEDIIINDTETSSVREKTIRLDDDGTWRVHAGQTLTEFDGLGGCEDQQAGDKT
jgi:ABC-type transport system substrate-binding protein